MTKDRVSALCRGLDERVELFRDRPLEGEHWTKIRSTNPLERVNREIGRRSAVRRALADGDLGAP